MFSFFESIYYVFHTFNFSLFDVHSPQGIRKSKAYEALNGGAKLGKIMYK